MSKGKSNLRQVAKAAGVSLTTASRVLNGSDIPAEQTRRRVVKAAKALDYQLDPTFGRTISAKRHGFDSPHKKTGLVGLFMPPNMKAGLFQTAFDDHYGRGTAAIEHALSAGNCHLLLHTPGHVSEILQTAVQRGLDGLILWGCFSNEDHEQIGYLCNQYPCVLIESAHLDWRADSVMLNAESAMRKQLQYLWDLGHRQIAYFEHNNPRSPQIQRLRAFTEFFASKHVQYPLPKLNRPREITPLTNELVLDDFTQELLEVAPRPTALIASSFCVLGIMRRLQDRGLGIPEDISIIAANDDWYGGHLSHPALTAYHMPMDELGRQATCLLLERIDNPTLPSRHLLLDGHPLERASCGAVDTSGESERAGQADFLDFNQATPAPAEIQKAGQSLP